MYTLYTLYVYLCETLCIYVYLRGSISIPIPIPMYLYLCFFLDLYLYLHLYLPINIHIYIHNACRFSYPCLSIYRSIYLSNLSNLLYRYIDRIDSKATGTSSRPSLCRTSIQAIWAWTTTKTFYFVRGISNYLSIYRSIYLSVYLSIYLPNHI